ncbi:MAG: nucleotidyltransferase domain-containing protein [Endomicrobiales bacterium]|nr:nucleotidyltransferase domain-containing protein [Endomicrobiales bacterium]
MIKNIIFSTNQQKVLDFLLGRPDEEFYDRQISKLTGISRAGANFALRDLEKTGIIKKKVQGKMNFYGITNSKIVRQLRIMKNILDLEVVLEEIMPISTRVVLYGSSSKGTNSKESDYDLFVISDNRKKIEMECLKSGLGEKIKPVIMTINEFAKLKIQNKVFYNQINEGIELWP